MKHISCRGSPPALPGQTGLLIYLERKQTHNFHKRVLTPGGYLHTFYFTLGRCWWQTSLQAFHNYYGLTCSLKLEAWGKRGRAGRACLRGSVRTPPPPPLLQMGPGQRERGRGVCILQLTRGKPEGGEALGDGEAPGGPWALEAAVLPLQPLAFPCEDSCLLSLTWLPSNDPDPQILSLIVSTCGSEPLGRWAMTNKSSRSYLPFWKASRIFHTQTTHLFFFPPPPTSYWRC